MGAENYTLGRGELHFSKFAAGTTVKTSERYFGNSPEVNLSVETETLDHFNSDRGIRTKDKTIILEESRSGSFILDEMSNENVALWFSGDVAIRVQAMAASIVQNIAADFVSPGNYIQLGESLTNPTGVRGITFTSLTSDPVGTTFILGTDYTVDLDLGRLYIVPGGAITEGDPLIATYATLANTRDQVTVAEGTTVEGALRFISYNPTGPRRDYFWPYVQLRADGDFALKGDEWQQLSFSFDVLKLTGYAALYIDGRAST